MAIPSVKYWNNLKLKQYSKHSLKEAISTNEIDVNSQASHLFLFAWCAVHLSWALRKKNPSNYLISNDY